MWCHIQWRVVGESVAFIKGGVYKIGLLGHRHERYVIMLLIICANLHLHLVLRSLAVERVNLLYMWFGIRITAAMSAVSMLVVIQMCWWCSVRTDVTVELLG